MKKFEILWELPTCDAETHMTWANAIGKNGTNRLALCKLAINLQSVKNAVSAKCNKVKHRKTRCAHIMKSLCLYEHGKICRRIHCKLLAWRPFFWFTKKKKKSQHYQPSKKGFESSLPTPSEPSSRELGVFTVSTVSLLLPTLCLRCWGNNRNKNIWWIIRGPMMLCITVRTTPPTLFPLWAQQLWRTPPPSLPPIKFSGSERTWARSLEMKMLSRGLDLLNEKKQIRNSSWVLCHGRSKCAI